MYLPPVLRRDLAQLDQFLGRGVEGRRVDQRRADAERARLHLLADQASHLVELFRRRLAVLEADHVLADGRRADERRDVGARCRALRARCRYSASVVQVMSNLMSPFSS